MSRVTLLHNSAAVNHTVCPTVEVSLEAKGDGRGMKAALGQSGTEEAEDSRMGVSLKSLKELEFFFTNSFFCVLVFHVCEGSQWLIIASDGLRSTFKTLAFHLHTKWFSAVGTVVSHMKVGGLILCPGPCLLWTPRVCLWVLCRYSTFLPRSMTHT